jgi:Dyp-type peroxidase family
MSSTIPPSGLPKAGTEFIGLNVGFSSIGLAKLGLVESLNDEAFDRGQLRDAKDLGDNGTDKGGSFYPNWDSDFQQVTHGIFQITAHDQNKATAFLQQLDSAFTSGLKKVLLCRASFRPPPETPNEHFGYKDGISKPEIEGVTFDEKRPMKFKGSPVVDMGVIVMGHDGDEDRASRPSWAVDGSFFVFRKLKSYVPEFNDFLDREGSKLFPNIPRAKAAARLGARLFGRWKSGNTTSVQYNYLDVLIIAPFSGTPVVLSPDEDDPAIANDPSRLNNFDYNKTDQATCPFSAHTRKSFPRGDIATSKKHLSVYITICIAIVIYRYFQIQATRHSIWT